MAIEAYVPVSKIEKTLDTIESAPVDVVTDVATAAAYEEIIDSADHVNEVIDELTQNAESVIPETVEPDDISNMNNYTKKLTLDESISDFNFKNLSDESDEDDYLDYDMFDFVYGIVTDDWPKPKNPLDHPIRKFQHVGTDDYIKTNSTTGITQVATDMNGNVVVYGNNVSDFDDIKAVCDYYHIEYGEVRAKANKESHWPFSLTIYVPQTADGYPDMAEDFFAQYGLSMSDVIEDHKVGQGKVANWGKTYNNRATKDRADSSKFVNDKSVDTAYNKYVRLAANSDAPLEEFISNMFKELDEKGLRYSRAVLKRKFIAEFDDDFEDEE